MKVLVKNWEHPERGWLTSVSKNSVDLNVTVMEERKNKRCKSVGPRQWATIPDEHGLADMVEGGTVFLENDELRLIQY